MQSSISRAGRWSLAFTVVALGACSEASTAPSPAGPHVAVADVVTSTELTTVEFTADSAKIDRYYGDVRVFGTAKCSTGAHEQHESKCSALNGLTPKVRQNALGGVTSRSVAERLRWRCPPASDGSACGSSSTHGA